MKTKVVYVLISGSEDIYTEQLYISLWSCRRYNPDVETVVLTDPETLQHLQNYLGIKDLVSEIIVKEFPVEMSRICRSRILKTTIPEMLDGSFLYIDVDTVVTDSLEEIDFLDNEISLVEDRHVKYYSQTGMLKLILKRSFKYYKRIPGLNVKYYNGGVLYCKNSSVGKDFFKDWHSNWLKYIEHSEDFLDQTALFETTERYKEYVRPLGHLYNVQVGAYKNPYKDNGKILHFYNSSIGYYYKPLHPFFGREYYMLIKDKGKLSDKVKDDIINCKDLFRYDFYNKGLKYVPTVIIDIYRHLRWKTYYNLLRPFSYFYYRRKLKKKNK